MREYLCDHKNNLELHLKNAPFQFIAENWNFCPVCGAERPKEPDERGILEMIYEHHRSKTGCRWDGHNLCPDLKTLILERFTLRKEVAQ